MKIRKFKKSDAEKCKEIIYSCVNSAKHMNLKERKFLKDYYTSEKIIRYSKKSDFFVVLNNKKIIGMGRLEKSKIATLYFSPKFHRKGGGRLIVKKLTQIAKKKKLKKVYVESLLQSPGFYKKLGFVKIKLLKKPIRSWKMEKVL